MRDTIASILLMRFLGDLRHRAPVPEVQAPLTGPVLAVGVGQRLTRRVPGSTFDTSTIYRVGPMATPARSVTDLLQAWSGGDPAALDRLVPIVYQELRRQAERFVRQESPGHTLQTTALVHETYLRLVDQRQARWQTGRSSSA